MTEQRKRSYLPWCDSCLWFASFGNDVGSGKCRAYGPMIAADPEQPDWPVVMGDDTCPRHETAEQEEDNDC
jgi:hypothetical protein